MSEQKPKMFLAIILAIVSVSLLAGVSYRFFPSQESTQNLPQPHPQETPSIMPSIAPSPTGYVSPAPSPIESPSINNTATPPFPRVLVELSPWPGIDGSLKIAQGESISINVTLTSYSSQTEFTIPLYLAIGAYQNQPLTSGYMIIATPPPPYSNQMPWPSEHIDYSAVSKPFSATYEQNPLILKPKEIATTILTIKAFENATLGTYSMIVELGLWQQPSGTGGTTFQLTVTPK